MLRKIGGVVVGIIAWIVIVQVGEFVVHRLYPPPPGYNQRDMGQAKRYVATLPAPAMVIVLVGQVVGTFAGAFAAAKIGRSRVPAYVIGAVLLVAGVASTFIFPQPLWFVVLELAGYIGATIAGAMLGSPHHVQTQSS
jgi:MFS family permease